MSAGASKSTPHGTARDNGERKQRVHYVKIHPTTWSLVGKDNRTVRRAQTRNTGQGRGRGDMSAGTSTAQAESHAALDLVHPKPCTQ